MNQTNGPNIEPWPGVFRGDTKGGAEKNLQSRVPIHTASSSV